MWERVALWIDASHDALRAARRACSHLAGNARWPREAQEDLVLVVSELVTNACRYTDGPCRMSLEVSADTAVVEVWDTSSDLPALPEALPVEPCAQSVTCGGYGLGIVAVLAQCIEVLPHETGGKTVRAVVVPDGAGPSAAAT
ncbi:ATP-binding protein [Streptomyces sp. NPDC085932]|uniref:ATP-binding protein n=1 Tax=Streptomyces sp. NPDC085932 TaxID=3365741 RepID=UPI0037CE64D1